MPFPLLLLLLVGGAVAVAASSGQKVESLQLAPGAFRKGAVGYEKFRDPVLVCLEQSVAPDGKPYRFDVGFSYLDTENSATARVGAMRARIGAPPSSISTFPTTELGRLAEASYRNVQKLAVSISSAYSKASQWSSIAQSFGLPVAEVAAQARRIAELRAGSQSVLIREAARYAPVAQSLMGAVASIAYGRVTKEEAYAQAAEVFGTAIAAAVANTVPIVGAAVSLATTLVAQELRLRAERKEKLCAGYLASIDASIRSAMEQNFPFPVHVMQDFGGPCDEANKPRRTEQMLEDIVAGNVQAFRKLSVRDKAAVVQWWTLAASLMSQPEVFAVFDKLGHGNVGRIGIPPYGNGAGYVGRDVGLYGGALGSDEQVLLVAAPYAVANGYPVDYFARALWEQSAGWRGADRESFMFTANKSRSFSVCTYGEGARVGAAEGGMVEERCFPICGGADVPMNAWALNFAVLSREAEALTRTLPRPTT